MLQSAAVSTLHAETLRIAVAGNPNSGKTTVFDALSGLRHKVGNYPGVTVEKREGRIPGTPLLLLDLPGTYGLSARSPDEEIARDVLLGRVPGAGRPDGILLVVDAANLERNLYLVLQVLEFGIPTIVACNMMDVARTRGIEPDCKVLSRELGVPVLPVSADRGEGVDRIRDALNNITDCTPPIRPWRLGDAVENTIAEVARIMDVSGTVPARSVRGSAMLWLSDYLSGEDAAGQSARRFLDKLSPQYATALRNLADELGRDNQDMTAEIIEGRYAWISSVAERAVRRPLAHRGDGAGRDRPVSDRIDTVLTHRVWGVFVFAGVVFCVFLSVFSWAEPLMGMIESGQGAIADWVGSHLAEGPLRSLIIDGVIAGVGSVVIFFPQICLMFLIVAILEDSGYMARAAFLTDRFMRSVGLPGKAFVPLIVGFGCNVPAIMAARTLDNARDRIVTVLMAPFMSCGARLAVYALFAAAFFPSGGQNIVFALYIIGIAAAVVTGVIVKRTILLGEPTPFIMELPAYHVPRLRDVCIHAWNRLKTFIFGAGKVIVIVVVIMSFLNSLGTDGTFGNQDSDKSTLSAIGRVIVPVFEPMGIESDNWPATVGIFTGIFAKEAVVGTLNALYSGLAESEEVAAGAEADGGSSLLAGLGEAVMSIPENFVGLAAAITDPLGLDIGDVSSTDVAAEEQGVSTGTFGAMAERFNGGIGAFAYLLFILLYTPCVAAMGAIVREVGGRWATFVGLWTFGFAYAAAVATYQAGTFAAHPTESILALGAVALGFIGAIAGLRIAGQISQRIEMNKTRAAEGDGS